ncbi:MAG: hypothetical protein AAGG07_11780 [Planctomycetota bacterium]
MSPSRRTPESYRWLKLAIRLGLLLACGLWVKAMLWTRPDHSEYIQYDIRSMRMERAWLVDGRWVRYVSPAPITRFVGRTHNECEWITMIAVHQRGRGNYGDHLLSYCIEHSSRAVASLEQDGRMTQCGTQALRSVIRGWLDQRPGDAGLGTPSFESLHAVSEMEASPFGVMTRHPVHEASVKFWAVLQLLYAIETVTDEHGLSDQDVMAIDSWIVSETARIVGAQSESMRSRGGWNRYADSLHRIRRATFERHAQKSGVD